MNLHPLNTHTDSLYLATLRDYIEDSYTPCIEAEGLGLIYPNLPPAYIEFMYLIGNGFGVSCGPWDRLVPNSYYEYKDIANMQTWGRELIPSIPSQAFVWLIEGGKVHYLIENNTYSHKVGDAGPIPNGTFDEYINSLIYKRRKERVRDVAAQAYAYKDTVRYARRYTRGRK